MKGMAFFTIIALAAPLGLSAATVTEQGGGRYDITSDTFFTGTANSGTGGAGSHSVELFTPGPFRIAKADAKACPRCGAGITLLGVPLSMLCYPPAILHRDQPQEARATAGDGAYDMEEGPSPGRRSVALFLAAAITACAAAPSVWRSGTTARRRWCAW